MKLLALPPHPCPPMLLLMKVPIEIVPQLQNQMIAQQRERKKMEPIITTCTTIIIITFTLHHLVTLTSCQEVPVT